MNTIRLDLRAVIYREDEWWIAHCLELDLPAEGDSPQQALESLSDLINVQVEVALEKGDLESIFRPAPAKLWQMFSIAGRNIPARKQSLPHVERFDVRELELV